ncbi:MAG: hypothetical protein V3V78_02010 [Candidatus Woesearchaeota archaeon]
MKRIVCFSTGNTYQFRTSINKDIEICLKTGADGIEVVFPFVKDLMKFKLTKENKKGLMKLKYNTVHMPFFDKNKNQLYLFNTPRCKKIVEKAYKLAKDINAININFHPNQMKNPKVLDGFEDMGFTLENLTEKRGYTVTDYKKMLKKESKFDFLLDTSHAIRTNQMKTLIDNLKDKIKFIHLSGAKGLRDDHYLVYRFKHKNRKQLDLIKKLKCPVIIEAGKDKDLTVKDFKKEVKYVRKWLNS